MSNQPEEKPEPIEVTPPVHKYWYETPGGDVTTFRLRLMSREQIAAHGLEKYAIRDSAPERREDDE